MKSDMSEPLYLRPNTIAEPLIDQWYAHPHLIAPATAAMNMVEKQLSIMESYVKAPHVHATAAKNPAMAGGPFINYPDDRSADIKQLIEHTRNKRTTLFDLHEALGSLQRLLAAHEAGSSLEPLYPQIPDVLRGYVELVYDLQHRASYRLLEPLLYRSPFYDTSRQSMMLTLADRDERPFILSTPRLEEPESLSVNAPLASPAFDKLFAAANRAIPLQDIADGFGPEVSAESLLPFFTQTAPLYEPRFDKTGVRWRYFGHACVLVETADVSILVDPVVSYGYPSDIDRFTFENLGESIDYVLLTHAHADHVLFETLLRIRHKVRNVIVPRAGAGALQDPSLRLMLETLGFANVRELDNLEMIRVGGGTITGLPFLGEHGDLAVASKLAYRIDVGNRSFVFAADSANLEPRIYERLASQLGPVDTLFLGMECDGAPMSWLYGPLFDKPPSRKHDNGRRLAGSDYNRALGIVKAIRCKELYIYAMGEEPWLGYVMSVAYTSESAPIVQSNKLIDTCRQEGIVAERLFAKKERYLEAR